MFLPVLLLASAVAAPETRGQQPRMPESFTPPAGLCRLWIDGVPASQQPAPTDCASAIRNRPSNAAVVFGPQRRDETLDMRPFSGRVRPPMVRRLAPEVRQAEGRQPETRQPEVRQPEVRPAETKPAQAREEVRVRPPERAPDRAPEPAVIPAKRKPEKPQ